MNSKNWRSRKATGRVYSTGIGVLLVLSLLTTSGVETGFDDNYTAITAKPSIDLLSELSDTESHIALAGDSILLGIQNMNAETAAEEIETEVEETTEPATVEETIEPETEPPTESEPEQVVEEISEDYSYDNEDYYEEENYTEDVWIDWSEYGYVDKSVPNGTGYCKSSFMPYMSYTAVRAVSSPQYKLLYNGYNSYTGEQGYVYDSDGGMRIWECNGDVRYCIALGSAYTHNIGQRVDLIMWDGTVVPCVIGDAKADCHTDWTHQYGLNGGVAEFITAGWYSSMTGSVSGTIGVSGEISYIRVYD